MLPDPAKMNDVQTALSVSDANDAYVSTSSLKKQITSVQMFPVSERENGRGSMEAIPQKYDFALQSIEFIMGRQEFQYISRQNLALGSKWKYRAKYESILFK